MQSRLGILAYGSLIRDAGPELQDLIVDRRSAKTPFMVEFARKSRTRGWGPTLVPFAQGASIVGTVLVLDRGVSVEVAEDMLWRRETRRKPPASYPRTAPRDGPNAVTLVRHEQIADVETVLSVSLPSNVDPDPYKLAQLAIRSVSAQRDAEDGISYLLGVKDDGIVTPVMVAYEIEILRQTGASDLAEARVVAEARGRLGGDEAYP